MKKMLAQIKSAIQGMLGACALLTVQGCADSSMYHVMDDDPVCSVYTNVGENIEK